MCSWFNTIFFAKIMPTHSKKQITYKFQLSWEQNPLRTFYYSLRCIKLCFITIRDYLIRLIVTYIEAQNNVVGLLLKYFDFYIFGFVLLCLTFMQKGVRQRKYIFLRNTCFHSLYARSSQPSNVAAHMLKVTRLW